MSGNTATPKFGIPPAPAVPFLDGLPNSISVQWYRFLYNLFQTVGSGQSEVDFGQLQQFFVAQRLALTVPPWLSVSGSPVGGVTGINGTLAISGEVTGANQVVASPNGVAGQVNARALVGADLPNPTSTTLGGVEAYAPITNQFLTGITTGGQPNSAQPAFVNIAGAIVGSQSAQGVATNSNATAGYPGEYLEVSVPSGSAVSLTTATPADVASVQLTAGDWDVYGNIAFLVAAGTSITGLDGWINTSSATLPNGSNHGANIALRLPFTTGAAQIIPVGAIRLSLASTTTAYLSTQAAFTVSTLAGYGTVWARRSANVF